MGVLPLAPVEKIIRKAGAERVGGDAAEALAIILEERALGIASQAIKLAQHAGRKTVTAEDIRLAK
jgi:histone H3/H4